MKCRTFLLMLLACILGGCFWVTTAMAQVPAKHPPETAKSEDGDAEPDKPHGPITYKAGVQLESITGFDAAKGTYSAEFVLFLHCDREPCNPQIDAVNAKAPLGKPDKLVDEKTHKIYKYKAELNAMVDMAEFPFDGHVLPLVLEDKADPDEVKWELDASTTSFDAAKCKLPGFAPVAWLAEAVKEDIGDGKSVGQIRFGLGIQRQKFAGFMSNLLPPLVMALFVMGATLFMKPKAAQGRIGGTSGSLLALVMFHKGALPPGGTLTLLDKFMIATYLVYVLNIVFSVIMLRMDDKKKEKPAEIAYLVAWGAVPGFAVLVWAAVLSGLL